MSPRACRSESITTPPAGQQGLIQYHDEKSFTFRKRIIPDEDDDDYSASESELDAASDASYDANDSNDSDDSSLSSSLLIESHGR